jgi:rhamnogalacturonyl hydrolase YesR
LNPDGGKKTAFDYARAGADTLIRLFAVEEIPPKDRFHYHRGAFLSGVERMGKYTIIAPTGAVDCPQWPLETR